MDAELLSGTNDGNLWSGNGTQDNNIPNGFVAIANLIIIYLYFVFFSSCMTCDSWEWVREA